MFSYLMFFYFFSSRKWSSLCSTTCVLSSANDMSKFMNYLLGNGSIPGTNDVLLAKKIHRDLFDAYNRLQDPSIEDYFLTIRGVPVSRTHFAYAMGIKRGMYNSKHHYLTPHTFQNL